MTERVINRGTYQTGATENNNRLWAERMGREFAQAQSRVWSESMGGEFAQAQRREWVESLQRIRVEEETFVNKPECAKSRQWVMFFNEKDYLTYVGIGGENEAPDGKFQIQKSEAGYNLLFCVNFGSQSCSFIRISDVKNNEDGRRLTTDNQLPPTILCSKKLIKILWLLSP
ncbi:hypothetical protein V8G54_012124 [Vigna mungo]|uniref:Uncharacterized protein n=1 Tax=Vigna mungo TaxID=3915 RepID=A0AAQ3NU48_VIGMU